MNAESARLQDEAVRSVAEFLLDKQDPALLNTLKPLAGSSFESDRYFAADLLKYLALDFHEASELILDLARAPRARQRMTATFAASDTHPNDTQFDALSRLISDKSAQVERRVQFMLLDTRPKQFLPKMRQSWAKAKTESHSDLWHSAVRFVRDGFYLCLSKFDNSIEVTFAEHADTPLSVRGVTVTVSKSKEWFARRRIAEVIKEIQQEEHNSLRDAYEQMDDWNRLCTKEEIYMDKRKEIAHQAHVRLHGEHSEELIRASDERLRTRLNQGLDWYATGPKSLSPSREQLAHITDPPEGEYLSLGLDGNS